jgi:hypothetical protein
MLLIGASNPTSWSLAWATTQSGPDSNLRFRPPVQNRVQCQVAFSATTV